MKPSAIKVIKRTQSVFWTVLICISSSFTLQAATLQELLDQAVSAFTEGAYSEAYWHFESMELDYGTEPEFLTPKFQALTLPVRAYSALMAERPTDALIYFDILLKAHNPDQRVRAFILYNIAVAQAQTGALAAAAESYANFRKLYPGSNESGLALLQEADLRDQIGEKAKATELLDNFYASEAPLTLRMQGRLRALQIASESGQVERTQDILFNTDWSIGKMPDIAVLSFAALDAGDLLLQEGNYQEAIRAYRLAYPRDVLIEQQRERLIATQTTLAQQSALASSIWRAHSQQLIARLQRQLDLLETIEDYTPGLYLRSGQAFLLASRFREATILFRTVAQSKDFENEIRAEAHYRWILAQCEAENWSEARTIAENFLEVHPKHMLAQSALFLISRTYQGEGKFTDAISVLDTLIENYPKDTQAARWYFTRGYNYCVLEQQDRARVNFNAAIEQFPKSTLVEQNELWRALTYFFERNYAESLIRLEALLKKTETHPIHPEVIFRIANIHYAERDYAETLQIADSLIERFPDHHRAPEMFALKGDTYMGLGELIQAAAAFRKVPTDDAQLYDYAVFQANKIYKALERYDLMQTHLQAYVDREDASERARVSEALYWIGWALQQEGRAEAAFPILDDALTRFGDDPEARAVESILSAYAKLYRYNERASGETEGGFNVWLQKATEQSLIEARLTWFARLTVFRANLQRRELGEAAANAVILTIHPFVPIEKQDAPTLALVGVLLADKGYAIADEYFEYILNEYGKRPERAAAFYGKALLASQNNQLATARRWLVRFLEETPTYPLAPDARLLAADVLTRQGLYDAATDVLNEILQLKEMRGRPHARALAGLARIEMEKGNAKRAIPYWQRVYTLYRAYPELVAEAYWESAQLFAEIGDPVAASNTLAELLREQRLEGTPGYAQAEAKLPEYENAAKAYTELSEISTETEATP